MAAAVVIAAGIGAAASAYSANQASKNASKAMSAQERQAQADLDFRKMQYDRYMGLMGPIEDKLAQEAQSSAPLDYDKNAAAIKQNYGNAQRNITNAMGMRGIAGSGLDVGSMRAAAFGQAGELSAANAQGLIDRRNLGLTLTGRGQIGQAANGVGVGMQGMTNLWGNRANLYNGAAAQGWQNFGTGLNGIAGMLQQGNMPSQEQPTATTNAFMPQDNPQVIEPRDTSGLPNSWDPSAWGG